MKKNLLIIAAILFISSTSMFAQGEKIGYVDSQIILTQYPAAIKAQGDLDALTNLWSAQLDSMTLEYQQALSNYQQQASTMPEDQQLAAQQNIVGMEQRIVEFRMVYDFAYDAFPGTYATTTEVGYVGTVTDSGVTINGVVY